MEEDRLHALIECAAGCAADDPAWLAVWTVIEPAIWEMVDRPRFASHLTHTEAARQRIVSKLYAHLVADHCRPLQCYLDACRINRRLGFARWLRTTAKRISYASSVLVEPAIPRRRSVRRMMR